MTDSGLATGYYQRTGSNYDTLHVHEGDEHYLALTYLSSIIDLVGATSVLDVGAGTGRALEYLRRRYPGMRVLGLEPEPELRRIAVQEKGIPADSLVEGNGEKLPFSDGSFDVVCEFGVMHHVKQSRVVVKEMMRVARKAVALSDENRFAYGNWVGRWVKIALCHLGLFDALYWVVTRGKGHRYSEGDGLAYSYSVFDSINELSAWGDRLVMVTLDRNATAPATTTRSTVFQPILSSFRMMVVAVRDCYEGIDRNDLHSRLSEETRRSV
jgi:SAM-dependent methyltransferase